MREADKKGSIQGSLQCSKFLALWLDILKTRHQVAEITKPCGYKGRNKTSTENFNQKSVKTAIRKVEWQNLWFLGLLPRVLVKMHWGMRPSCMGDIAYSSWKQATKKWKSGSITQDRITELSQYQRWWAPMKEKKGKKERVSHICKFQATVWILAERFPFFFPSISFIKVSVLTLFKCDPATTLKLTPHITTSLFKYDSVPTLNLTPTLLLPTFFWESSWLNTHRGSAPGIRSCQTD